VTKVRELKRSESIEKGNLYRKGGVALLCKKRANLLAIGGGLKRFGVLVDFGGAKEGPGGNGVPTRKRFLTICHYYRMGKGETMPFPIRRGG